MAPPEVPQALTEALAGVALVDQHCHGVLTEPMPADQPPADATARLRRLFTESDDERMLASVPSSLAYQRMLRRLAVQLGCAVDEAAVVAARQAVGTVAHTAAIFADAHLGTLLLDDGYPPASAVVPSADLTSQCGVSTGRIMRLEPLFERLLGEGFPTVAQLREQVRNLVVEARSAGAVGLKTVVGYRTGLGVHRHDPAAVEQAFDAASGVVATRGSVRLGYQPLLDTLLLDAFEVAAAEQLPVQIHVGYGDTDADLRRANPLELRDLLEDPAMRDTSFVLLHGCWPYPREGAYLASVYGNVWLDLSYGIPFLGRRELVALTRAAVATAPIDRIVYSSDGSALPELHWIGAHEGRHAIGAVLGEAVADDELDLPTACRLGERILAGTSRQLYALPGAS